MTLKCFVGMQIRVFAIWSVKTAVSGTFHDFPCFARLHLVVLSAGFLTLVPHRVLDPTLHAERVACCLLVKPQ